FIALPSTAAGPDDNLFVLTIDGDGMIEAGILDKDMVIVKQKNTAKNKEIIVAKTDKNEEKVKRFVKEKKHIHLKPENAIMQPLQYENVTVLGKVTGLYRDIIH